MIQGLFLNPVPFEERKTPLRGVLDLAAFRYPAFCFGGSIAPGILPVFHFHDVSTQYLEPYLKYLADNGYKTVTSAEMDGFIRKGMKLDHGSVVLCFDDAWRSLWTNVYPLLSNYRMKAVAYAIPSKIEDAPSTRPFGDANGSMFATWPELIEMKRSGIIDVQAHTFSHALIYCDPHVVDFVRP